MKIDINKIIDIGVYLYVVWRIIAYVNEGNFTKAWIDIGILVMLIGMQFVMDAHKKKRDGK